MPEAPVAGPPARSRSELDKLLRLSAPLIAGHAGNQLMGLVDTAMVGRLGSASLAGVSIGSGLYFGLTVIGMGCVLGMDPLVAQEIGAGEHARARRTLWQGVRIALALSVPIMALIALTTLLLTPIGVEAKAAEEAARFMFGRLPGVITFLVFTAMRSYLQSAGGTRTIILAMVMANIANFFGNVVLIYGDDGLARLGLPAIGLPPLGVLGSGLSSSLASAASLAITILGVRAIAVPHDPARRAADRAALRKIISLGMPIALQLLAEVGAFAIAGVLAGRMGSEPSAGFQVAITLASLTFTVTLGIASAATVLVGQAVGRGDTAGARSAGFMALRTAAGFMALAALAFFAMPGALARILSDKPDVLAAAIPLVQIAAVFQISDGLQVVASGALRGAGDTRFSQQANIIGHYVLGLPLAVALGIWANLGAPGLWWGLSAGLTFVAVALTLRFHWLTKKTLARV